MSGVIEDLCPEQDELLRLAWRDCLMWSINSKGPNFMEFYREQTGNSWRAPTNGLERMIDEATGHTAAAYAKGYILWFNEFVWGTYEEDGE